MRDARRPFRKNVDKTYYNNVITGSLRVGGFLKKSQFVTG